MKSVSKRMLYFLRQTQMIYKSYSKRMLYFLRQTHVIYKSCMYSACIEINLYKLAVILRTATNTSILNHMVAYTTYACTYIQ